MDPRQWLDVAEVQARRVASPRQPATLGEALRLGVLRGVAWALIVWFNAFLVPAFLEALALHGTIA